jgi:putative nucleotidyltransferase with HDIG domain
MASTKSISIDRLKPGMFVVGMDQPWYRTPFLFHKRLISNPEDIAQLKHHGIQEVTIDLERGLDVQEGAEAAVEPVQKNDDPIAEEPPTEPAGAESDSKEILRQQTAAANAAYREGALAMERIFRDLDAGQSPKIAALKQVVAALLNRILMHPESMMTQVCLQKMRGFDRTLASHAMDICILGLIIGVEYGCEEADRETLGMGALLHDIGYVRLPRNIYRKSTPLTDHEKTLMQQHPQLASTMLSQTDQLPEAVGRIIAQHHECHDGSGFPKKLKHEAISTLAQLVGLVDTYDGMVGIRHGRPPMLPHDAIRQLFVLGEKGRYDKALVEVAIKALGVYPIGSLLKLSTGECAVVVGLNHEDRLKPKIRIISGPKGDMHEQPIEINLTIAHTDDPPRTILRALDPVHEHVDLPTYFEPASVL